jgi:hypothetical protein
MSMAILRQLVLLKADGVATPTGGNLTGVKNITGDGTGNISDFVDITATGAVAANKGVFGAGGITVAGLAAFNGGIQNNGDLDNTGDINLDGDGYGEPVADSGREFWTWRELGQV